MNKKSSGVKGNTIDFGSIIKGSIPFLIIKTQIYYTIWGKMEEFNL